MSAAAAIEVVAGVLSDGAGRVLLAQRMPPRDWGGRWEFPGGKREPGEAAAVALARELREELGVTVLESAPLIRVPWNGAPRPIVLDAHTVTHWQGLPVAREGQALRWQPPQALVRAEMPPADWPVALALRLPPLLRITPPSFDHAQRPRLLAALQAGDALLRLRLDDPMRARELAEALAAEAAAMSRQRLLLDGTRIDLARALGCGVHLQAAQLRTLRARPVPASQWCGASCRAAADLALAQALDCDFAVLGPVRPTPTHPAAAALGWTRFAALCARTALPVYALGGLTPADLPAARAAGAQGVAGIRAFWR